MNREKLIESMAETFAEDLFTPGYGAKAKRLVMVTDANPLRGTGWSKRVIQQKVAEMLTDFALSVSGWTAIEDGLPEVEDDYLITFRWSEEGEALYVMDMYFRPQFGWIEADEGPLSTAREIRAWMPLPAPYEPQDKSK